MSFQKIHWRYSDLREAREDRLDLSRQYEAEGQVHPKRSYPWVCGGFEVIESYPEDKYLPSYLIYARFEGSVIHVVFAADVPDQNVRIVTAYRPAPEEWSEDFKKRK